MDDQKPRIKPLGPLGSGPKSGGRLGSLRDDGAGPSGSAAPPGVSKLPRFKPRNFSRADAPPAAAVGEARAAAVAAGHVEDGAKPRSRHEQLVQAAEADLNMRRGRRREGKAGPAAAAELQRAEVAFGGAVGEAPVEKKARKKTEDSRAVAGTSKGGDLKSGKKEAGTSGKGAGARKAGGDSALGGGKEAGGSPRGGKAGGKAGGRRLVKVAEVEPEGTESYTETESESDDSGSSEGASDSEPAPRDLIDRGEYYPTLLYADQAQPESRSDGVGAAADELGALMSELSFLGDAARQEDGQLLLFQMPSKLPIPVPDGTPHYDADLPGTSAAAEAAAAAGERPAALSELGSCRLGKLLVFRSGRVKLRVGDVLFDVNPGIPCKIRQEVAVVSAEGGECIMLGDIRQRVVVTPDVEALLSDEPIPDWPRAAARQPAAAAAKAAAPKAAGRRQVIVDSSEEEEEVGAENGAGRGLERRAAEVEMEEVLGEGVEMEVDGGHAEAQAAPAQQLGRRRRGKGKGEKAEAAAAAKEEDEEAVPSRDPRRGGRKP